jgi:predicted RNase H-like HicB family nuclease
VPVAVLRDAKKQGPKAPIVSTANIEVRSSCVRDAGGIYNGFAGWGGNRKVSCYNDFATAAFKDRDMPMIYTIKATIHSGEQSGYVAECVDLPIVTQGATLDEVTRNLREAIALHLEGEDLKELGFTPNPPILISYEMEPVRAQA